MKVTKMCRGGSPAVLMWTDRWIVRHDETNSRFLRLLYENA
jgi:hypothetical protein